MSVALGHDQTVLLSLEEVSLIQHLVIAFGKVPLPLYVDISAPFPDAPRSGCLVLVGVERDNQGKPE